MLFYLDADELFALLEAGMVLDTPGYAVYQVLDRLAQEAGFGDWVQAYHNLRD